MSYNYTLKYRRFDQLLDDIKVDFQNYSLENMIEPQQLIKVAKRVNYDLGLRVYKTKETLLEIRKGYAKLPDDFFVLNYAMVCDDVTVNQGIPQGTWIEERPLVTPYQSVPATIDTCVPAVVNCVECGTTNCSCNQGCVSAADFTCPTEANYCNKPRVVMNCKGDCYELVQIVNAGLSYTYRRIYPIKIIENPQMVECGCPNLYVRTDEMAWIKDGYFYSTMKDATIYISYQGQLEDEDGNLLIPDHDMLNEYYEYAIKQRILENLMMNDENVTAKLQLVEARLRAARNYALTIVNTPNFAEMNRLWLANRTAMYGRYYNMFKSYGAIPASITYNNFINGVNK